MTRVFIGALPALTLLVATAQAMATPYTYHNYTVMTLQPGAKDSRPAYCEPGDIVVGGGWYTAPDKVFIYESRPLGSENDPDWVVDRWQVGAKNNSDTSITVYIDVMCLGGDDGASSYRVFEGKSVGAGEQDSASPSCEEGGGHLSGGGFYSYSTSNDFFPYESRPTGDELKWQTSFANGLSKTKSFYGYAVCVEDLGGSFYTAAGPSVWILAQSAGAESTKCNKDSDLMLGGGYSTAYAHWNPGWEYIYRSYPYNEGFHYEWEVGIINFSDETNDIMTPYARCVDLW